MAHQQKTTKDDINASDERIINGIPWESGDLWGDWYAGFNMGTQGWCGSSLVAENFALTAKHCLAANNIHYGSPSLDDHQTDSLYQAYPSSFATNSSSQSDLAVLYFVDDALTFSSYDSNVFANPIPIQFSYMIDLFAPLTTENNPYAAHGSTGFAAGYGTQQSGQALYPDSLEIVSVPWSLAGDGNAAYTALNNSESCNSVSGYGNVNSYENCYGDHGVDACQGDSGGPLTILYLYDTVNDEFSIYNNNDLISGEIQNNFDPYVTESVDDLNTFMSNYDTYMLEPQTYNGETVGVNILTGATSSGNGCAANNFPGIYADTAADQEMVCNFVLERLDIEKDFLTHHLGGNANLDTYETDISLDNPLLLGCAVHWAINQNSITKGEGQFITLKYLFPTFSPATAANFCDSNSSSGNSNAAICEYQCPFNEIDECGVCNGDGYDYTDTNNVTCCEHTTTCNPLGGMPLCPAEEGPINTLDACGTCDNNASNDCIQDCNGEWGGNSEVDMCGFCVSDIGTEGCHAPTTDYCLGDSNDDGTIDVLDIVEITNWVISGTYDLSGDANNDGAINVLDLVALINVIISGDECTTTIDGCLPGFSIDCNSNYCVFDGIIEQVVGNGTCDEDDYLFNLNCEPNSAEVEDCETAVDCMGNPFDNYDGIYSGYDCIYDDGTCFDIDGNGIIVDWLGDGFCDDGTYNIFLNCEAYSNDCDDCGGGDMDDVNGYCDGGGGITTCDGCVNDFTAYGSECCDTAWDEYGIDCATLESSYNWDCAGCNCSGDKNYVPSDSKEDLKVRALDLDDFDDGLLL